VDPEAIEYDEVLHGPSGGDLEKMSTTSSAGTVESVVEEEVEEKK
jgi:hypothetical protein